MTMRKTPYRGLRYPFATDVVDAAALQTTAADIDSSLVNTDLYRTDFARMSSVAVTSSTAAAITKATLTAISFTSVELDNGTNSAIANGSWWAAGTPTRLTAPSACVVVANGSAGLSLSAALGTAGYIEVAVTRNGGTGQPDYQGSKWTPISTVTGQQWTSVMSMWKLAAGDYLELKIRWGGTPAGPINIDNAVQPYLSLAVIALPSVP